MVIELCFELLLCWRRFVCLGQRLYVSPPDLCILLSVGSGSHSRHGGLAWFGQAGQARPGWSWSDVKNMFEQTTIHSRQHSQSALSGRGETTLLYEGCMKAGWLFSKLRRSCSTMSTSWRCIISAFTKEVHLEAQATLDFKRW